MYAPPGFGLAEVGDVEVFPEGDRLHLFHLTLPNHDVVQHVVSEDGLAWTALPNALRTSDPGACDDDQIWTMSVTERAGAAGGDADPRYAMLYTALSRAERGLVQRTALALSDDLIHWTKSAANPVGEADPRWYEATTAESGRVSWRDPKPIRVGDTYYAAVCGRERAGPKHRRGVVGLLASADLLTWEPRPPLFAPHRGWDLECPQVFEIGGHYYLTAALMEDRTQRYWVADQFEGPYQTPAGGNILVPKGHYAGRICRWQGLDLYYCWHRPVPVPGQFGEYDWPGFRNPAGKLVPPPLVLEQHPDGTLTCASFPGWEQYRAAPPAPAQADCPAGWQLTTAPGSVEIVAGTHDRPDVLFEGALTLQAAAGGLIFRLDDDEGGYTITLTPGTADVILAKSFETIRPEDALPWLRYQELQRGQLRQPLTAGEAHTFRLLVVGAYIECSIDGEVVIATASQERQSGRFGVWAESGQASIADARWSPMRRPAHR